MRQTTLALTALVLSLSAHANAQSGCLETPVRLTDTYKGEQLFGVCTADYAVQYSLSDRNPHLRPRWPSSWYPHATYSDTPPLKGLTY